MNKPEDAAGIMSQEVTAPQDLIAHTPRDELGGRSPLQYHAEESAKLVAADVPVERLAQELRAVTAAAALAMERTSADLRAQADRVINFIQSPVFQELNGTVRGWFTAAVEAGDLLQISFLSGLTDGDALGAVYKALADCVGAAELGGLTFADIITPGAAGSPSLFDRATNLVSVIGHRAKTFDFPVDKVNSTVWGLPQAVLAGAVPIKAEKKGRPEVDIVFSIDFDAAAAKSDSPILRRLTAFDKLIYVAVGALWSAGNQYVSTEQIYRAAGGRSNLPGATRKKIDDSMFKMLAPVIIDNSQEERAGYRYCYEDLKFPYEGPLLPFERGPAKINGRLVKDAYHLFREPPLITFARCRRQITTFPVVLLQAPVNKSEMNIAIMSYLLTRIAHVKRGQAPAKILYATLYKAVEIDGSAAKQRKQQQEARRVIHEYLLHFQASGEIKGFTTDSGGVTVKV